MIEGKGQQILNTIQLSPTKTISTRMHNICMFFTWCFHKQNYCGVSTNKTIVVFPQTKLLWCFHKQNYYIICMFINLTNTLSC